jgi:hypothetical protein
MGNWNNKSGVPCDDLCASFECGCLGDKTWKERHAKGVPVKLYMTDEDFNKRMAWYELDTEFDDNMHLISGDDEPYVYALTETADVAGSFCNFRYKEKGGSHE